ncbi:MAG: Crp/Fnr family transcriptional regulator [Elusimicrobia bacterium]|nr:Crp/Fnr family transcriptional regulator [Elusimicrobiota bacterium]
MITKPQLPGFLAGSAPVFKGISPRLLARLAASASVRRFARGELICHSGERVRDIWVLLEGRVCVNRCSWKGGRVNLEIMVPGEIFGLPALTLWSYPSDIQAVRPSAAAAIPRQRLLDEIKGDPALAQSVFGVIAQRLDFIEAQLTLSREPVERRLAAALIYLGRKFGAEIALTSAEIGEMAQTTPETAMRKLKVFERDGLLRRSRGKVEIADLVRLEARISSPSDLGRPSAGWASSRSALQKRR